MFLVGFLLYVLVVACYYLFAPINDIISNVLLLAPEITLIIIAFYVYPFLVAGFHVVAKRKEAKDYTFLSKQTTLAASVCVSMGLIGTFMGLTQMISAIAASTSGGGDISEQMQQLIGSISVALSAMSYAFLTSILGVAASVLLVVSLNFWSFRYSSNEGSGTKYPQNDMEGLHQKINELSAVNVSLHDKLLDQTTRDQAALTLVETIRDLCEDFRQSNQAVIEHQTEIGTQLERLAQSQETTAQSLSSLVTADTQRFEQAQLHHTETCQHLSQLNNEFISAYSTNHDLISDVVNRLNTTNDSLEAMSVLNQKAIEETREGFGSTQETLTEVINRIHTTNESLAALSALNQAGINETREGFSQTKETLAEVVKLNRKLNSAVYINNNFMQHVVRGAEKDKHKLRNYLKTLVEL